MFHENEVIMLIMGLIVLILFFFNFQRLQSVFSFKLFFAGYCLMTTGWIATVLEGYVWESGLNFLEHSCYAAGMIVLAAWCWKLPAKRSEKP
jgi:hypothetical protein